MNPIEGLRAAQRLIEDAIVLREAGMPWRDCRFECSVEPMWWDQHPPDERPVFNVWAQGGGDLVEWMRRMGAAPVVVAPFGPGGCIEFPWYADRTETTSDGKRRRTRQRTVALSLANGWLTTTEREVVVLDLAPEPPPPLPVDALAGDTP